MKKIFATIDCETDPFSVKQGTDIKPFIWGIYTGKDYYKFDSTLEMVTFVKKKAWNFFAHNGGKFDYIFMLDFMGRVNDEYGEKAQTIKIINGRISRFKMGRATFYDSYNILPVPQSKMKKDDFEYWKLAKSVRAAHMAEIEAYLRSDCVNLYGFVKAFHDRFNAKITLASTAADQFEMLCAPMPKSNLEYHETFKPFYYGGRVTPFEIGIIKADKTKNEEIKIYDINSAYPTAMRYKHPYGTGLNKNVVNIGAFLPDNNGDIEACFIELSCDVLSVNNLNYGCFPVRNKDGIDFPIGKNTFKVTGWEYLAAIKTNAIKDAKILNCWWFTDLMSFEKYVDNFYADKLAAERAGDDVARLFAKLMLNSQYGKFCQDSRRFMDYKIVSAELGYKFLEHGSVNGELFLDMELGENEDGEPNVIQKWTQINSYANGMVMIEAPIVKDHTKDGSFYNIATGASITGWVRAFMWESICKVERPLYCDTDSIACFNGDNLELGDKLGQWDCELDGVHKMAIAGKKMYAAFVTGKKSKTACKGVVLTDKQIESVALGNEVQYIKESPVFSIKSSPRMLTRFVNRKDKKDENVKKRLASAG